jgi:AH receptor-interacting protein
MANIILGDDPSCGIKKRVLHASRKPDLPDYPDGTRVTFYYQTRLCDSDKTVVDDNRKDGKPMELIFGKKFKLEVWETCLKSMRVSEVASFVVDVSLVGSYPVVAKNLRDIRKGARAHHHHCCGMTLKEHGLGYADLDNLLQHPQPLEFILELLTVEMPGEYNKESWAMDYDEKLAAVPGLRDDGNRLYKESEYHQAATKYTEALSILEQLCLREKPGDPEFVTLDMMKVPFLLNLAQCLLQLNDYYPAIEHATEVLKREPDNVKALYRRAKAHVGAWNPKEARSDFERVIQLDPSLAKAVQKELKIVSDLEKEKASQDRVLLEGKMFS